jgi:hypothetical protein
LAKLINRRGFYQFQFKKAHIHTKPKYFKLQFPKVNHKFLTLNELKKPNHETREKDFIPFAITRHCCLVVLKR